jgi:hypothetical protein
MVTAMPEIPAICRTCGTMFRSGIVVENTRGVAFGGNIAGPCPNCGGIGDIPDGVYDVVGDVVSVVATTARSYEQLERLATILRDARESGATPDQLVDAVEKESPDVGAALRRLLLPRNAGEFGVWLVRSWPRSSFSRRGERASRRGHLIHSRSRRSLTVRSTRS